MEPGADGQIHAVIVLPELGEGHVLAHGGVPVDLHPCGEDGVNVPIQVGGGQAVGGDAVPQHAPQHGLALIHRHLVAHEGEEVGRREAGRAAAHNGHLLARGRGQVGHRDLPGVVHGKPLDAPDVQRGVHNGPAAVGLAGVLAHQATDRGEGIVLTDQADGVGIPLLPHQGDVAGHVHMGRT